jgi:hypothetical protein
MNAGLKLAGHAVSFIIQKVRNMKKAEHQTAKDQKSGNVSKVVGSLVAGAAVGLAAGILLAPDKGKKTRAKLLDEAKDMTAKLKKNVGEKLNPMTENE